MTARFFTDGWYEEDMAIVISEEYLMRGNFRADRVQICFDGLNLSVTQFGRELDVIELLSSFGEKENPTSVHYMSIL